MKYGYQIYRGQEHGYTKLYLEIYSHDGHRWTRLASVEWQTDSTYNYWYGFMVKLNPALYGGEFAVAVRVLDKISKLCYSGTPEQVIESLKLVRLAYDDRIQQMVTVKEYEATAKLTAYQFYFNGTYQDLFLAKDVYDAWAHVTAQATKGEYSHSNRILENPGGWQIKDANIAYKVVPSLERELSL